jgi:hypothetical protein
MEDVRINDVKRILDERKINYCHLGNNQYFLFTDNRILVQELFSYFDFKYKTKVVEDINGFYYIVLTILWSTI